MHAGRCAQGAFPSCKKGEQELCSRRTEVCIPALQLALLGAYQLSLAGTLVTRFPTVKVQALLAYLAVEAHKAHTRDALIGLFWPEYTEESARQNLRQALFRLRQVIPSNYLLVTNQNVQFNPASDYRLDVTRFTEWVKACRSHDHADLAACAECSQRLQQAVELYRGDFLAGFFLDDCPAFEEWLLLKREWLRREALQALAHLADYYERQGAYAQAQVYAWRQVELDPPREEAHQQLMRVLALSGRRSEALAQYESCRRLLAEELGVEPSVETVALSEQIRSGEVGKRTEPFSGATGIPEARTATSPPSTLSTHPVIPAPGPSLPSPMDTGNAIRLVTVLCVGVSESDDTELEETPEGTAERIQRLLQLSEPILGRYQARLDRMLTDSILAVFGAEQIHEDDPERGVLAALAIRRAAQADGLEVSAGLTTGLVFVGQTGTTSVSGGNVSGSVVNLAVRLQAQAAPGQILVGQNTYRRTYAAIQYTPLALMLPGRSRTLAVYQVERPHLRPQKTRGLTPHHAALVGRGRELAELQQALATAQAGAGQVVALIGEAGIGKSRLVAELKQAALTAADAPTWLEGRCLEMTLATSYWPFLDLLRTYLAWQPDDEEQQRAGRIVAALDALVAAGHLTPAQREEMGPLLGTLLAVHFGHEWDERLKFAGPEQLRHQTLLALRDFFIALSQQHPLVLVLEDLHWSDMLSLDLIMLLMDVLTQHPLLLVCVYRPERQHRSWQLASLAATKCPECLTELRLRELTARQSQELVEALLTIENLTPRVRELILQRAQGNPLFVEEVIRSLIDAGIVYRQGDAWRAKEEIEGVEVPESVQSVILSRVDRLSEVLKEVLQRAAVIGRVFSRRLLAQLTPAQVDLDQVVLALADQAFIYQERVVPEEEYSFKHVLLQEAVYQTMLNERRAQFHRQAAEAMEQLYAGNLAEYYEQLAYHYDHSNVVEKAIGYLLNAGEKARRTYVNEEAISHFRRVLERLDEQGQQRGHVVEEIQQIWRLEALKGLGRVYHLRGKTNEAEGYYRKAIALGQAIQAAPREWMRLYFRLGEVLYWQGRYGEITSLGEEGLALLGADTQSTEAVMVNCTVGYGHFFSGNIEIARDFFLRNAQYIESLPYSEDLTSPYLTIMRAYAHIERDVNTGMKWAYIVQHQAEQHHHIQGLAIINLHKASSLKIARGDLRGAIGDLDQGLQLFAKIGEPHEESRCLDLLSYIYLRLGELNRSEEYAWRALDTARMAVYTQGIANAYQLLACIHGCRGIWTGAVDLLQKAIQITQKTNHFKEETYSIYHLARVYLAQGKPWEALRQMEEVILPPALLRSTMMVNFGSIIDDFVRVLHALDVACEDNELFRAYCQRIYAETPERISRFLVQWFLEPFETPDRLQGGDCRRTEDEIQTLPGKIQQGEWTWHDQFEDCSYTIHNGLRIHAANGRDLWHINMSAPRFLRPLVGDFAVETICLPESAEKPVVGGILLWKDKDNFLRLDLGTYGKQSITFLGYLDNNDVVIGRGRLPVERVYLRLERRDKHIRAFCSADREVWFRVGFVDFAVEDPVEVGMYAIGNIDRLIYPGAHANGTAIRFESFELYRD